MGRYATGKYAIGLCDVCGFQYDKGELKATFVRGRPTGILSCPTCWDEDHPQNFVGMQKIDDAQAIREPRPDSSLAQIRSITVPVYNFRDGGYTSIGSAVGRVTVSVV